MTVIHFISARVPSRVEQNRSHDRLSKIAPQGQRGALSKAAKRPGNDKKSGISLDSGVS